MKAPRRTLLLLALLAACADGGDGRGASNDDSSDGCLVVTRDMTLPEDIKEGSGVAFSTTVRGVLWTHNDSGNDPELFAINSGAQEVGSLQVPARMRDWEDMAVGPCPEGSCVYLADTGDSKRHKEDPVSLFVAPEPHGTAGTVGPLHAYTARYPDGKVHDAEALFVLPGGEVYLITKGTHDVIDLYRWPAPLREGQLATLVRVRGLAAEPEQPGDRVTGASASPDGRFVAVRTYSLLNVYRTADLVGGSPASPAPIRRTDLVPLGEPQGEGVALANDGTVALISEGHGRHVPGMLSVLRCPLK